MPKKDKPKNSAEDEKFQKELNKLKLSAEHGISFAEKEKDNPNPKEESEKEFLFRMREMEEAIANPNKAEIKELLGSPNFPKVETLSDEEVTAALELVTTSLANRNVVLDVIYPTAEREIYRFITEELMKRSAGMAGAGGMTMHYIYEEFYPNHKEELKSVATKTLRYLCSDEDIYMPWQIASKVSIYGDKVSEEEFLAILKDQRNVLKGNRFINVDSLKIKFDELNAYVKTKFRFESDKKSTSPKEVSAEAEFFFELSYDSYWLIQLVIKQFGIS